MSRVDGSARMRPRRALAAVACAICAACRGVGGGSDDFEGTSSVGLGPFHQFSNHVIRPSIVPAIPSRVREGEMEVGVYEDVANHWGQNRGDYRVDFGSLSTAVEVAYGVGEGTRLAFEVRDFSRTSSFLDEVTDAFHEVFGFSDDHRDSFEHDDNVVDLTERNGFPGVVDEDSGSAWRHYGVSVEKNLTPIDGVERSWVVGADARFLDRVKGTLDGGSHWSFAGSGGGAQRLGRRWHVYLGVGYAWLGEDRWHDLLLERNQITGLAALEWRRSERSSWLFQVLQSDDVTRERAPWDDSSTELLIGWVGESKDGTRVEIALIENAVYFGTAPDFGVHLAIRQRF